jgi:hypothetical protein
VYRALTIGARWPLVALPAARRLGHGVVVTPATRLVIEGFPRSGNSAAVAGFLAAQPEPVEVAHHTHAPANVLAGVRGRIPVLLVARHPREATTEFVLTKPALTVGDALVGYVRFHAPLVRARRRFLVATTDEILADLGSVVSRLNAKFGTSFARPIAVTENDARTKAAVERYWASREGPGLPLVGRTTAAAPPDPDAAARLGTDYEASRLTARRVAAERLYTLLTGRS